MIAPYQGPLVNLVVDPEEWPRLIDRARGLSSLPLSPRSVCDLALLSTGAFSPLTQFMRRADYERVLAEMRLETGALWPIPITLPVSRADAARLGIGEEIALRNEAGEILAVMRVEEIYEWEREKESVSVLGTADPAHPLVAEMAEWGPVCVSGPLRALGAPAGPDFVELRLTPSQVRGRLESLGFAHVAAFQTRNPLHRSHEEITKRAARSIDGALLLHPVVGLTRPGDVDHVTRMRSYSVLVEKYYDPKRTVLAVLPLAMRLAGPKEALWHAIIRRNHGATHFIVGRDHAGPGKNSKGEPFYEPYAAQELVERHAQEIGVRMIPFQELVYLPAEDRYEEEGRVAKGMPTLRISGTEVRNDYLAKGRPLPEWFTRPEIAKILAEAHPPPTRRGFCVWFTGLPCSGKSTTAEILTSLLGEHGRRVTLLDGDVVRNRLSKGLGFSRADRDENIRRIGFVAMEVVRHGGAVVCAAISPYRDAREECRAMIGEDRFLEVFVDTPLAVCEQRDTKGLYAKARRGELAKLTGVNDPYETPTRPDLVLETVSTTPADNARRIISLLIQREFLALSG